MLKQIFILDDSGFIKDFLSIEVDQEGIPLVEPPHRYVDGLLPQDDRGYQLPFWRPRWTGTEWVEDKTQLEFEEDAYVQSLIPSDTEIADAEFEIKTLNILMEVGIL